MVVKANEKQLSFLFQETDSYFEMGDLILYKAHLTHMLPYKKIEQNQKEKIVFYLNDFIPVSKVISSMEQNDIIDVLYAMIFLIEKVEENGFLTKECIWCKYEHIYFDTVDKKPMFALLPISGEFRYADGMDWNNRFLTAITHIAEALPTEKFNQILDLVRLMLSGQMACTEVLEIINGLGSGFSDRKVGRKLNKADKKIIFEACEGTEKFSFEATDDEFVIGSDSIKADKVKLISEALSQKHCKIIKQNNIFFVQNLDAKKQTLLNGECIPVYELAQLSNNDVLTLADIDFRVYISE